MPPITKEEDVFTIGPQAIIALLFSFLTLVSILWGVLESRQKSYYPGLLTLSYLIMGAGSMITEWNQTGHIYVLFIYGILPFGIMADWIACKLREKGPNKRL